MAKTPSFKRLILRAVLRQVSPMVIRLVSVSDHMPLPQFHDVFRMILGWNGDLGYIIRVHGQDSTASGGRRGRKHCTSLSCTGRRSSSTSATPCTCGSGTFASWIGGGRLPKRRQRGTTPAGPDDRAAGTGDGNAWHEFDREQSVVGRRAGARRVGATTCLSTLPQAVHDQGLRQHPS